MMRKTILLFTAAITAILMAAGVALGATPSGTPDAKNTRPAVQEGPSLSPGEWTGQVFRAIGSGKLTSVQVPIARYSGDLNKTTWNDDISVQILGTTPVGTFVYRPDDNTVLATKTIPASAITKRCTFSACEFDPVTVNFNNAPDIVGGTRYAIVLTVDGQVDQYVWQWTGLIDAQVNGMYVKNGRTNNEWSSAQGEMVYAIYLNGDTTAPTVSSVTPTQTTKVPPLTATISATFSEEMKPLDATNFKLQKLSGKGKRATYVDVAGVVGMDPVSTTATLTPNSSLAANTTYKVTVTSGDTGAKDLAGNALAADKVWSFKTASK